MLLARIETFGSLIACCLFTSTAAACPFCQSQTADKVRAGILDEDFGYHAFALAAPFPVLIGILLLIYFGPPTSMLKLLSPKSLHPRPEFQFTEAKDNHES